MIKIAVCDDRAEELRLLEGMAGGYAALRPLHEVSVESYPSPYALLEEVERGRFHDLYILDILMPGMGGIELGRRIRERNDLCAILFSTVTPEYALEAFRVSAQNYLVKPFRAEELHAAMDRALRGLKEDRAGGISFRTAEGLAFLPFHQIAYIELAERRLEFHQPDGAVTRSLVLRASFEEALAGLLTEPRFVQTHKSFVVNMDHVHMRAGLRMVLNGGAEVPMSARRKAGVLDRYFTYLSVRRR